MLRQEADLSKDLARIRSIEGTGGSVARVDVRPLVRRLQPPHPHHYLAVEAAHLQGEMYHKTEQWKEAAKKLIECREAIVHLPSRTTALLTECMGGHLMHAAGAESAGEKRGAFLSQAGQAYIRAAQGLLITCGPSDPMTTRVVNKVAKLYGTTPPGGRADEGGGAEALAAPKQAVTQEQQQPGSGGKKTKPFAWLKKKK